MRRLYTAFERASEASETVGLHIARRWHRWGPLRHRLRRRPLAWGTLFAALFCLLSIAAVDQPLARLLKASVGGNVEGFFKVVTTLGEAQIYLVSAALAWLFCLWRAKRAVLPDIRRKWRAFGWRPAYLFLSVAVSGILVDIVKMVVGRPRPVMLFEQGITALHPFSHIWTFTSFPSGHSQTAWAAMTALAVLVPRYDLPWVIIAVLVAASRVATTVHYLSDVVAGGWVGLATAVLLARILRRRGVKI